MRLQYYTVQYSTVRTVQYSTTASIFWVGLGLGSGFESQRVRCNLKKMLPFRGFSLVSPAFCRER